MWPVNMSHQRQRTEAASSPLSRIPCLPARHGHKLRARMLFVLSLPLGPGLPWFEKNTLAYSPRGQHVGPSLIIYILCLLSPSLKQGHFTGGQQKLKSALSKGGLKC